MKRVFYHYKSWEDYKNGMYKNSIPNAELINQSINILSNSELLYSKMEEVVNRWIYATEHNLTDKGRNRNAWLGQSACCIANNKISENITKIAWNSLNKNTQKKANMIAELIIKNWELNYKLKCQKNIQQISMF